MTPLSVVPTSEEAEPAADANVPTEETFSLSVLPALPDAVQSATPVAMSDAESPLNARIGKAMHRLLEWGVVTFDANPRTLAAVTAAGQEFSLSPLDAQKAAELARSIATGAGSWAWHPDVVAWQGNEVDMLYQGQALRLDRLVQRKDGSANGQWWVLDYKSAPNPERQPQLISQLQTYRAAVEHAYPGAMVKAAFLTGDGQVVEVP
jgi:ATP-dependent helicase/nuclease subunit A